jgi:hydrogenase maturation protein HypF
MAQPRKTGILAGPIVQETGRVTARVRRAVRVAGIVQGVGFRPFVYSLATRLGLAGRVGNDVDGVFVEVEGASARVDQFLVELQRDAPGLARIDRLVSVDVEPVGELRFEIVASVAAGERNVLVSADTATCADCLRELADPADRRFGYAFINCTNCGPRFTIVRDVPYDRPLTTIAGSRCARRARPSTTSRGTGRFHAQPTCCPACGLRLRLLDVSGSTCPGDRSRRQLA